MSKDNRKKGAYASAKKKIGQGKKQTTPLARAPKKSHWEFAVFTKKSMVFNRAANRLGRALKALYGDEVTISFYEKMLSNLPSMPDDRKDLIYIDPMVIELHSKFTFAKEARDTERESFRSDIAIANIEGGLAAAKIIAAEGSMLNDDDMEIK
jgi:hypothetical protein